MLNKLVSMKKNMSFAHLAALAKRAEASPQEDDDKPASQRAEDSDLAEEEPEENKGKSGRRARRAESEQDDKSDTNEDDDEDQEPRSRRARGESEGGKDDDDDQEAEDEEEELQGKSAVARARRRERARCAAIFGSRFAARNPVLAANLAFNTSMTRKQALAVLRDTPGATGGSQSSRAARNPTLGAGGADAPSRQAVISNHWDRAMQRARGNR